MPYNDVGYLGDLWKHFPLCECLANEQPNRFIDVEPTLPFERITGTPAQQYGVLHIAKKIHYTDVLKQSQLWKLLTLDSRNSGGIFSYLGSTVQSTQTLSADSQFIVLGQDEKVEAAARSYFKAQTHPLKAKFHLGESKKAFYDLSLELGKGDFVFVAPHEVFTADTRGYRYFDGFCRAIRCGAQGLVWYEFTGYQEQKSIHQQLQSFLGDNVLLRGVEIFSTQMKERPSHHQPNTALPMAGFGVLAGHFKKSTYDTMYAMARELQRVYKNSLVNGLYDGSLEVKEYSIMI